VLVVGAMMVAACGSAGLKHRVKPGENLYRIGQAYGVSHRELARANGITNPDRIEVGQVIEIPSATRELPVDVITPAQARGERPTAREMPSGSAPFVWPVAAGTLSSTFGPRRASHHDGIDVSAPEGTPVRAARSGRVLYSDELRGYGNIVIIEHDEGYASVYAHNKENQKRAGDLVRQGEVIALLGETGKTSGPNLHFEIRKDNIARNPLFYLPPIPGSTASGPRPGERDS
jgi:murein DD-endopeptidase MepM/ murein hydrolase activator NlpD